MTRKVIHYARRHHVGVLALFIALSGSAYAATSLPRNSVGTRQLRKNAVTSAKVEDRSLLARDFKPGQLPAGPPGAQGPQGPAGPQGSAGATKVVVRGSGPGFDTATASCEPGERATGGGGVSSGGFVDGSYPEPSSGTPTAWKATAADAQYGEPADVSAWVVCASP